MDPGLESKFKESRSPASPVRAHLFPGLSSTPRFCSRTLSLPPHPQGTVGELGPQLRGCVWLAAGVRHLVSLQGQQRLVDAADGRVGSEIHLEPVAEKHLSNTISTPGLPGHRETVL